MSKYLLFLNIFKLSEAVPGRGSSMQFAMRIESLSESLKHKS